MKRLSICFCAGLACMVASPSLQAQDYRDNTLNFVDVTTLKINQTVAESGSVEKEVEFGDIDNDGDFDVAIAVARGAFGERRNKMYINDNGVFNEVSGTAVISDFSIPSTSRNVFFRDFDDDGWLDLIVTNDSNSGTNNDQDAGTTKFFHNKHAGGVFTHFANETSLRMGGARGAACSGLSFDLDQNGLPDLFMANYPFTSQDTMYFNGITANGPGYFTDMTSSHVPIESDYAVDVDAADLNGDGSLDLLIASLNDPNFIRYNNNGSGSSGMGDYQYNGSGAFTQFATTSGWPAFETGDFDGDGKVDFIYLNKGISGSSNRDVIFHNTGNDSNNKATFNEIPMSSDTASESTKATVKDIDGDGKVDLIVMAESRRPYIYRNASVPGQIKFIEWTPRSAIPGGGGGGAHDGWHTAVFDTDGDAREDLFIGAMNNDHLMRNVPSNEYEEANISGVLPTFHNNAPITVLGAAPMNGVDSYTASGITAGSNVSVMLRSFSDVILRVKSSSGTVIASSDVGLAHVAEAVQFEAPGGTITFEVEVKQVSGDGNMDGRVNLQDARMIRNCIFNNDPACLIFDFNASGNITLADAKLFRSQFSIGQASGDYVVEFNSRSN